MSIWIYKDVSIEPKLIWSISICPFCNSELKELSTDERRGGVRRTETETRVAICMTCGWPRALQYNRHIDHGGRFGVFSSTYGAVGSLKELDVTDISCPLNEIRSYLVAKYSDRFKIHPRKFEEIVASVFESLGYKSFLTNYRGDDGIDIFLYDNRGLIGVQVKRYSNSIAVEQIRSLAGAIVLNDLTRGIFVTTTNFQSGGENTVRRFKRKRRPIAIELMDSNHFFDALKIAQFEEHDIEKYFSSLSQNLLKNLTKLSETETFRDSGFFRFPNYID